MLLAILASARTSLKQINALQEKVALKIVAARKDFND